MLKKLEGALRHDNLNIVHKIATELTEISENSGVEQEVIDCFLRTHVPCWCDCFPDEARFGSQPEVKWLSFVFWMRLRFRSIAEAGTSKTEAVPQGVLRCVIGCRSCF